MATNDRSQPTGEVSLAPTVQELLAHCTTLWSECGEGPAFSRATYYPGEMLIRQMYLERFVDTILAEVKRPPQSKAERLATQRRLLSSFVVFARSAVGFEDPQLDLLTSSGMMEVAIEFAQQARRFDPAISGNDIFQALRNVWTMNSLQMLLGIPVQLTPAIFAYSLLYPYSDNYLDDPTIPAEAKASFNQRLARRLAGEALTPADAREQAVYDLVGLIEGQYGRAEHPQVHESLLAIHRAQESSLRLLRGENLTQADVLEIAMEKGGTSVLADGYLVAGSLTRPQAVFTFGWGAFLQLVDDLQDVVEDRRHGLMTVFSMAARRERLDMLTNRIFQFGFAVLRGLDCFDAPGIGPLKELIHRSAALLLIDAAGQVGRCFSKEYREELEACFPFAFVVVRRARRKLARKRASIGRLIEAYAVADD